MGPRPLTRITTRCDIEVVQDRANTSALLLEACPYRLTVATSFPSMVIVARPRVGPMAANQVKLRPVKVIVAVAPAPLDQ